MHSINQLFLIDFFVFRAKKEVILKLDAEKNIDLHNNSTRISGGQNPIFWQNHCHLLSRPFL